VLRFWRGTLTGGLAARILDTFLAMVQYGTGPIIVYQSVASGLLGRVLPLSAARRGPFAWVGLIGHAFCVGLPIALAARRAQR
jgi:hypothetical protein